MTNRRDFIKLGATAAGLAVAGETKGLDQIVQLGKKVIWACASISPVDEFADCDSRGKLLLSRQSS